MMRKIHHNTIGRIATITLLLGGMMIVNNMDVFGQQEKGDISSPPTSFLTDQTLEGWMTSFDLENCDFVSTGENSYFILKPGYQVTLVGEEDGEELQLVMTV